MTGFGRGQAGNGVAEVQVELSSVNRRGLEVSVSLPREFQTLEREVLEVVRKRFARGKIHVVVQVQLAEGASELLWDDEAVLGAWRKFERLSEAAECRVEDPGAVLLGLIALCRKSGESVPAEDFRGVVREAVEAGVEALAGMRKTEGGALEEDLQNRLEVLRQQLETIRIRAPEAVENYRELLFGRLRQMNLELDLDDERVLKEVAIFADRCDISEEITRFGSHLEQFEATLRTAETGNDGSQPQVGRKLEFILQEIHRETNTMGSKANQIEISRAVLACKNEIERMREQLQNVE